MTGEEFIDELTKAHETMRPLCGCALQSIYECSLIVCLIDGSSMQVAGTMCPLCPNRHKFPKVLHTRLEFSRKKFEEELVSITPDFMEDL